jgi:UDP-galactopyranose mutase
MSRYPGRVFFIEEPVIHEGTDKYEVTPTQSGNVSVVTPKLETRNEFDKDERLRILLDQLISSENISGYIAWYYSPMALRFSDHLDPLVTIYDCMDELSAFKFAPPELRELESELFNKADVVFTGGNALFEAKKNFHHNMYSFPSSIDRSHFIQARQNLQEPVDQSSIGHPRFGFFGVLDERLDIVLVDELARMRPDWNFIFVGPVVKIDPDSLPRRSNIFYLGGKTYSELPAYLAGWDVAMMPFAINDSTRFISPTKTPEYLCGGKPVISTPITDVVNDYGSAGLVHIAQNAGEFVIAGETVLKGEDSDGWLKKVDDRLAHNSWDITWQQMEALIDSLIYKLPTIEKSSNKTIKY